MREAISHLTKLTKILNMKDPFTESHDEKYLSQENVYNQDNSVQLYRQNKEKLQYHSLGYIWISKERREWCRDLLLFRATRSG